MKNLSTKQTVWALIAVLIVGFAFLFWAGHISRQYPGYNEARHITWLATKSAGIQYIIAIVILYGGYFLVSINSKK